MTAKVLPFAAQKKVERRAPKPRVAGNMEPAEYRLHSLMHAASWAFQTGQHSLGNAIISAIRNDGYGPWILIEDGAIQEAIDSTDMELALWGAKDDS